MSDAVLALAVPLADHPLYAGVMALVPAVLLPLVLVGLGVRERRRERREDAEDAAREAERAGGPAPGAA